MFTRCLRRASGIPPVHWYVSSHIPIPSDFFYGTNVVEAQQGAQFERKGVVAFIWKLIKALISRKDSLEFLSGQLKSRIGRVLLFSLYPLSRIHKHYSITQVIKEKKVLPFHFRNCQVPSLNAVLKLQWSERHYTLCLKRFFLTFLRDDEGPVGLDPSASVCAPHMVTLWLSC